MKVFGLKIKWLVILVLIIFSWQPAFARRVHIINEQVVPYSVFLSNRELPSYLENLSSSSWHSRTAVIPLGNGLVQAFKFLRKGESLAELEKEAEMLRELNTRGLDFVPFVISENGIFIFKYQGKLHGEPTVVDSSYQYITYIAPEDYFIYPEDIKDVEKMKECALRSITQFARLLQVGYLHKSLSPLTHERGSGRKWFWNYYPLGGIEKLAENLCYSNIGLSGLRDFAHVSKIDPYDYLYFSVGQAICEWVITLTYHSLRNGFSDREISNILEEGFKSYLAEWGLNGYIVDENIDKLQDFIGLFREEITANTLSSVADGGKPTVDKLSDFINNILVKNRESQAYRQLELRSLRVEDIATGNLINPRFTVMEGDYIYVADAGKGCLVKIDLHSGLSQDIAPGSLSDPVHMVLEDNFMYVADWGKQCLVRIDLSNGMFQDIAPGSLLDPCSMVKNGNFIYVADAGKQGLVKIDLNNGGYQNIFPGSLIEPRQMIGKEGVVYVTDWRKGWLVRIDLESGECRDIAAGSLVTPQDIVVKEGIAYLADWGKGCLVRVDLESGDYEDIAWGSLIKPEEMVEIDGIIYVIDLQDNHLVIIDLLTGEYKNIAFGSIVRPQGGMLEKDGIIYVADAVRKSIVKISFP
ncbi:MAG: hypothetical protein NC818_05675 [Candidatus Omnitrophica bacterium]|nr:hypothetical protein [Candidatus Omnitrophota bacterium]